MSFQDKNRIYAFINSNNLNQMTDINRLNIKVPFPPVIDPYNLIVKTKDGRIPSRAPNAFLIYHKIFIETAKNYGYHLPITVISSMSSQSWEQESDVVKAEYKRLAKKAYEVRNEMLPKSQRKKKREKWNIITFEKKSTRKGLTFETQKHANKSTMELIQFSSPISSQTICPVIQSETFSETGQKFDFDREIGQKFDQFNFDRETGQKFDQFNFDRETDQKFDFDRETGQKFDQFNFDRETGQKYDQFDFDLSQHMTPNVLNVPNAHNVPSSVISSSEKKNIDSIDLINFDNNQLLLCSDLSNISSPEINLQNYCNSFSDINDSPPIVTEEESFDLLEPFNEDNRINTYVTYEGLEISNSIEFIPTSTLSNNSKEILFSHKMLDIYDAFSETSNTISATITEPSCGLDFVYPYYL
jgi:hypothetical protein